MSSLTIRVGCKAGTWRVAGMSADDFLFQLKQRVEADHGVPVAEQRLSRDRAGKEPLEDRSTLAELKLAVNGQMLYLAYDIEVASGGGAAFGMKKIVNKDGSITDAPADASVGFRPGMRSLRSIKKHWNLSDFMLLDDEFNFYLKKGARAIENGAHQVVNACTSLHVDAALQDDLQNYMRRCGGSPFSVCRCGFLYGRFGEGGVVEVEAMYEPVQDGSAGGFELMEDEQEERADAVAAHLGWERVGVMFCHPPRPEGATLTGAEVIFAAQENLAAGADKPFVVVKCSVLEDGNADFTGFQVSDQCMKMVDANALLEAEDPNLCAVHESFTAMVEMKQKKAVEVEFFLLPRPILLLDLASDGDAGGGGTTRTGTGMGLNPPHPGGGSQMCSFPRANREGDAPSNAELGAHRRRMAAEGKPNIEQISDFHLLLFLSGSLGLDSDMKLICARVRAQAELEEGYELIIDSMAQ